MQCGRSRPERREGAGDDVMPSRQVAHNTIRLRRHELGQSGEEERGAGLSPTDVIVRSLEQRSLTMEDDPVAEDLRREALRELPSGLTLKRSVRAALSASVQRRPLSLYKRAKYGAAFAWRRGWARAREASFALEVWYGAISAIEGQFGSGVGSYFRTVRRLMLLNAALAALLLACAVLPQSLHSPRAPPALSADWLTGEGSLQDSLLFYGHYSPGWVLGGRYYMPFAYLLTALSAGAALCARLCYSAAASYRRHFIVSGGAQRLVFANKVFCGWDWGITAPRAAALHARALRDELQELAGEAAGAARRGATRCERAADALCAGLVVAGAGGALAGLRALQARAPAPALSPLSAAAAALWPALVLAAARLRPRPRPRAALTLAWLLPCALPLLLLAHWARSGTECWESRFGAETYRLLLLDSVLCLLVLPAVQLFRAFLNKEEAAPFPLAWHSLRLVYGQALVWSALAFCPLLAGAAALQLLLLFHVQRAGLRAPASPPPARRPPPALLDALLALTLAAALFALGSLFLRMPSTQCGPLREYDYVYMVVSEGLLRLGARPGLRAALGWLARPAVVALLLLLLCVAVYYMRAVARAQRSAVLLLRRMLALQATDKDFLLSAIRRVSDGEWLYSPRRGREGSAEAREAEGREAEGHTWRYVREVREPANSRFHLQARPRPAPPRAAHRGSGAPAGERTLSP